MTADNIWMEAVESASLDGLEVESRVGTSYEVLGFQGMGDPAHPFVWNKGRNLSPIYAAAELLWYMGADDDGEMICHYAPSYKNYLNNGIARGAYGPKIFGTLATKDIINELMIGPTRRAVIPIYGLEDLRNTRRARATKDVPCTLSLQFLNRDGALHCITTMRSNDVWKGLPYDMFAFMMIQLMMCEATGLRPGMYWHQAGSMHLYEQNAERATQAPPLEEMEAPLNIKLIHEVPTIERLHAIRPDEIWVRTGKSRGVEHLITRRYGEFSIATTLLTLASLQNYKFVADQDVQRLSAYVDSRLIKQAAGIVNARKST